MDGAYQLSNGPFGIANSGGNYSAFEYGIATVGMGLTGFGGNDVEGDNYGIAAGGSNLTLDGLPSALPLVDTYATFWILKPAALTSLDQVTGVRFTYGSLPDNAIDASNAVVEPASLALLGLGILGLAGITRVRRRKGVAEAGQSDPEGSIAYRPA